MGCKGTCGFSISSSAETLFGPKVYNQVYMAGKSRLILNNLGLSVLILQKKVTSKGHSSDLSTIYYQCWSK